MSVKFVDQPDQPPAYISRALIRLFAGLLKLYPRAFYLTFHEEMVEIFSQTLLETRQQGVGTNLRFLLRELGELPAAVLLEHIYIVRKKNMNTLHLNTHQEVNFIRWLARIMAVVINGLVLAVILFNEDVRTEPNLPVLLTLALTLSLLAALRWEKIGGTLSVIGAPLLFAAVVYNGLNLPGLTMPIWMLVLTALSLAAAFLVPGWLFVSIAGYAALTTASGHDENALPATGRRLGLLVLAGVVAVAVLILGVMGVTTPAGRQVEMAAPGTTHVDDIMLALRRQGAVVGVGNLPVEQPFATTIGQIIVVNNQEIVAFAYDDPGAAGRDAAAIAGGDAPGWAEFTQAGPVHLYRAGSVLLLYSGQDGTVLNLLRSTVGPPLVTVE